MTVPRLFVLTDRRRCAAAGRDLVTTVGHAVDAGAPVIVYREKDLDPGERERLGRPLAEVVSHAGAQLVIASDEALADRLGADGLHLAATDRVPAATARRSLTGRSCHDRGEVADAAAQPLDYITVSPVFPTTSKAGYGPALGTAGAAELATATDQPVLALGGVDVDQVAGLRAAGLHGVAVMGAVMGADDPAGTVSDLLRALGGSR